jgi:RimJ/RimL family protein N-acetyltransferase
VPQPTLHTERIALVPLAEEHLEHEVGLDADPEVLRYLFAGARPRAEVEQAHRRRLAAALPVPGLGFWAGFVDGGFVGWWILQPTHGPDQPRLPGWAELGYRLHRHWWRRGLASEGSRELLRHGFVDVGLEQVIAQTMAVNAGSRAVMESVGMRFVRAYAGEFDEPVAGSEHGEVEYAISREEWLALNPR